MVDFVVLNLKRNYVAVVVCTVVLSHAQVRALLLWLVRQGLSHWRGKQGENMGFPPPFFSLAAGDCFLGKYPETPTCPLATPHE